MANSCSDIVGKSFNHNNVQALLKTLFNPDLDRDKIESDFNHEQIDSITDNIIKFCNNFDLSKLSLDDRAKIVIFLLYQYGLLMDSRDDFNMA